ncbi:hypothetical protein F6T93_004168 [Enterobacter hormaechei]|nr:hypothetical protein [Enterobacter hormaechei]
MADNKYQQFLMKSALEKKEGKESYFEVSEVNVPKKTSDKIKLLMESLDITVDFAINISISYALYNHNLNNVGDMELENGDYVSVPFDISLKNLGEIKEIVGDKCDEIEIVYSKCVVNSVDIFCEKLNLEIVPSTPKPKMRFK